MLNNHGRIKLLHLEFLRVLSIIFVIYTHTNAFYIPSGKLSCYSDYILSFISTLVKAAVPLFFMISGALLLKKHESYVTLYRKRIWRFGVIIVLFAFFQNVWRLWKWGVNESSLSAFVKDTFMRLLEGTAYDAYVTWFLYAYMMLLVFLPFLRAMVSKMKENDYVYLLLICCVIESCIRVPYFICNEKMWPIIQHTPFMPRSLSNQFTAGYGAFYMLMGYFAENVLTKRMDNWKFRWGIVCISFGLLVLSTIVFCKVQDGQLMACFLPIPVICIYLWSKRIFEQSSIPGWMSKLLCLMGGGVFFVMLTENIWRYFVTHHVMPQVLLTETPHFVHVTFVLLVFVVSILTGMVCKCIPVLNKYI